jgi:hypothetical protein
VYNSTLQASGGTSVTLQGATLSYTGASGVGVVDASNGPLDIINIRDNHLYNVAINLSPTNLHVANVLGNTLDFTRNIGSAFDGIRVGPNLQNGSTGGYAVVSRNIFSSPAQTAGSRAVYTPQSDANNNPRVDVEGNVTVGFPIDLQVDWSGSNAGIILLGAVRDNRFGSATFVRHETGAAFSNIRLSNNYDGTNGAFPQAPDPSTYYNNGQIFGPSLPVTAGGFIGCVITTAGAPGTCKNYGAVVP